MPQLILFLSIFHSHACQLDPFNWMQIVITCLIPLSPWLSFVGGTNEENEEGSTFLESFLEENCHLPLDHITQSHIDQQRECFTFLMKYFFIVGSMAPRGACVRNIAKRIPIWRRRRRRIRFLRAVFKLPHGNESITLGRIWFHVLSFQLQCAC